MKLRCDAQATFPASCTRCSQSSLICRIDPDFRRTRKRAKSDTSRTSVSPHEQRAGFASQPSPSSFSLEPSSSSSTSPYLPQAAPLLALPPSLLPGTGPYLGIAPSPVSQARSHSGSPSLAPDFILGQVRVTAADAQVYFDEFFANYHPQVPIFASVRVPTSAFAEEPLLFWVVLLIGARRQPLEGSEFLTSGDIFSPLCHEVKMLATSILMDLRHRQLATVQALLLLCLWPIPTERMRSDTSDMFSSLAITIAISIGLHRPYHSHEFSSRVKVDPSSDVGLERRIAWHVCHLVNYSISLDHGFPSSVQDDWVNLDASSTNPTLAGIPLVIVQQLRIARFCDRVARSLGGSLDTPSGVPSTQGSAALLRGFSAELTDVERNLGRVSDEVSLLALFARVRLCAYCLQLEGNSPTLAAQKSQYCIESYVSCVRILELAIATNPAVLARWPRPLLWAFGQTCITLLHIVTTTEHVRKLDVAGALSKISESYRLSLLLGVRAGDLSSRFAKHLGFAAKDAHQRLPRSGAAKVTDSGDVVPATVSRFGVPNWLFDMVGRAKRLKAKARSTGMVSSASGTRDEFEQPQPSPRQPSSMGNTSTPPMGYGAVVAASPSTFVPSESASAGFPPEFPTILSQDQFDHLLQGFSWGDPAGSSNFLPEYPQQY